MKQFYVKVPVTDLRREPILASKDPGKDPLQESQVLYGEPVLVEKIVDGWARVNVPGQRKCTKEGEWCDYPGWIVAEHLSEHALPTQKAPCRRLLDHADAFLGMPYLWGGRSPCDPAVTSAKTGIDCSGLVHLLYQSIGVTLPRDAHDQYLVTKRCKKEELVPGDLIFSGNHQRIDHVMLYIGDGLLIEAAMSVGCVRKIPLSEKLASSTATAFSYGKV